jgi:hypothetical protein
LLVPPEGERRAPVQAVLTEHAEAPFAVAEDHQVFAEQARAHRRAVALGDFSRGAHGQPMAAHQLAHRGGAFHAAQQLVLLLGQHGAPALDLEI